MNRRALPPLPAACATISLGPTLPSSSSSLPGAQRGRAVPCPQADSLLLGLAPSGGCLAGTIAGPAGGLLHHLFTLTARFRGRRSFSVALSAGFPARALPGTVPCGARTFLGRPELVEGRPRSPGQPACPAIIAARRVGVNEIQYMGHGPPPHPLPFSRDAGKGRGFFRHPRNAPTVSTHAWEPGRSSAPTKGHLTPHTLPPPRPRATDLAQSQRRGGVGRVGPTQAAWNAGGVNARLTTPC